MNRVHKNFGHPGIQKTLSLISPHYYWREIISDVSNFSKHCDMCQRCKKSIKLPFGQLESLPPASFNPGDKVMLEIANQHNKGKLSPIKEGPYKILEKLSNVTFKIDKPNLTARKNFNIVHSSKLRTYVNPELFQCYKQSSVNPEHSEPEIYSLSELFDT